VANSRFRSALRWNRRSALRWNRRSALRWNRRSALRWNRRSALRWAVLAVALGLAVSAILARRGDLATAISRISAGAVLLSAGFAVVATVCTMLSWRSLLGDLGSPLPIRTAARIFLLSQVGKYLPGSVWPVLAQMELGRDHHVPARRSGTVAVLSLIVSVISGLLVAALALPLTSPAALRRYGFAFLAVPVLVTALHPRVLGPLLAWAFRFTRRGVPERAPTLRATGTALLWMLAAWAAFGAHLAVLVAAMGGTGAATVVTGSVGAFAVAWCVGFLVVVAPAGAGVREAVLIVALAPLLPSGPALFAALTSRTLLTIVDVVLALAFAGVDRKRPLAGGDPKRPLAGGDPSEPARSAPEGGAPDG
jgi:uncharacterized membrane protein YbhN (UPF0104 family)